MEYELVEFKYEDIAFEVVVTPLDETVWLSISDMAILFGRDRSTIGKHVKSILAEKSEESSVWARFARTGSDGKRYDVACYKLDVVVAVGDRIKSRNTQPFCSWCQRLFPAVCQGQVNNEPNLIRFHDGDISLDVKVAPEEDTVYLSQYQIACLFDTTQPNISMHIKSIVEEGELSLEETYQEFLLVQNEGEKQVSRMVGHYNLDMILSIGYRVKSKAAVSFRKWANSVLKEYLLKGHAIDERRTMVTPENYIGLIRRVDSMDERLARLEKDQNYFFKDQVIFEDHLFDALALIDSLIGKAVSSIVLVDPYCDVKTLNCFKGKPRGTELKIITSSKARVSKTDIAWFNREYANLTVVYDGNYHDRYLIIDGTYFYHLGASVNYLGKRFSQITLIQDEDIKGILRNRI